MDFSARSRGGIKAPLSWCKIYKYPGFKTEYREVMEEIKTGDTQSSTNNENEQADIRRESEKEARKEQAEERRVERERVSERRR